MAEEWGRPVWGQYVEWQEITLMPASLQRGLASLLEDIPTFPGAGEEQGCAAICLGHLLFLLPSGVPSTEQSV